MEIAQHHVVVDVGASYDEPSDSVTTRLITRSWSW